ncbi:MAG: cytochrome c family protein, partial [Myxococcota bacterium]|nr:cytochrome c family protein [Myxococcota bacterium]
MVACLAGLGCDPYSETRAGLDPAERIRFDRGVRAATPCWSCHDLTGDALKIGPPLQGLFGRKAGVVEDFPYSPALAQSSLHWNAQNLHRFLANPQATIPGN